MTCKKFSARPVVVCRTFAVNQRTAKLTGVIHKLFLSARDAEHARPHWEIVMQPDPFTDDDWHSEDVVWYPARFRKHCNRDRASCEAMLKFELKQIGNVRIAAYYESNPPQNHPLIDIIDAVIGPLRKLLISFPNDHPVINSYNRLFTELAMPGGRDKDYIEAWTPHWWRKTREFSALLKRPLDILRDVGAAAVPDVSNYEWWRRVLSVARILLLLWPFTTSLKSR
ncbi:hypothetical protein B0H16DRAFT_1455058 [Mycena metata]|uniref:Uncharacterized protein n=1 Tax=Mycena metata TaxID=1033252 RepID=A0AAD7JH79_9AGAR|nr:hypothetical protein B0H16DRAFT_1455058 [Mycena metata]